MSESTLTFEGLPAITGSARHGGDYVVFATQSLPSDNPLEAERHGTIEIEGQRERVSVEGVRRLEDRTEITLRLFTPIIG